VVPRGGTGKVTKNKDLARSLSRNAPIEAPKEFSASVPAFDPVEHSVYEGRKRLGRYSRISQQRYAAYDASGRLLGKFRGRRAAYSAVTRHADGGAQ
jgi:hypothetical protein